VPCLLFGLEWSFLLSVYYEFKLRVDCVSEEGLLRGIFWCEKQPKTSAGFVSMQINFFIRGLAWPYLLFSAETTDPLMKEVGVWSVVDNGSPFSIATAIPISKDNAFKAILLVFFNPKNSCKPELSAMAIGNNKLGNPIDQNKLSTHLKISAGRMFDKDYLAVFNKYTSGVEYAIRLEDDLLEEMNIGKLVVVSPSNTTSAWEFSLEGFQTLANAQHSACIQASGGLASSASL